MKSGMGRNDDPNPESEGIIEAAKALAIRAHAGQKRKWTGGYAYFEHPRRVAECVADLDGSDEMIAAAYLHDVLEDTQVTEQEILDATNLEVLRLVVELTNRRAKAIRIVRKRLDNDRLAGISLAAKFIKLMDRIDNLREMEGAPDDFKKLYAEESLELAEAIGDVSEHWKSVLLTLATELL